ncbi:Chitin synthase D [Cytospora mali]|uniref:chitin synthase n=1 Tax=Cytospora mali TaxID=578113 RepID=A0A194VWF8_CYTMA|nr:Chitin synthase D [Valsa mali]
MADSWAVKDIVYTAIVGIVMLAALLEWFLWIGAFMYCLWKVFRKSEHWTVNVLAVIIAVAFLLLRLIFLPIMVVTLPLPSQIVKYWPEEMVDFLMWFAFWSFAGLLTVPWLFCIYQLVTHQLGRTKRIKQLLDEDSAPKVVIVMPCYQEDPDVLITALNSVVDCDYPPSCIHVFLSFDGDQEDELFLTTIEKLGVPLTLETYPKSIDVAYKDARITVSRFPHGGKRTCQKATYKLIDRVYSEYLKRNDNLFILFIDSDCILDRVCLQNFLYDMEFSPGNRRNMLAMTGVITSTTKKHSIITLLQDMEYVHGQLFERSVESGCGSVTCLPGALTMLRFSAFRRMAKYYFADKAEQCEDLFDFAKDHLGEDRYLTHLFMIGAKQRYQIQMCTSAFCKTEAVQTYKSLVKQRRRWFLGFITNEACMLTDWRLWRRYPVLVLYRFCQNTIRTTALLFFILMLALLSTEKSINDLPVGFIAISLGLNWLMMIYFGAKLRRYKIWLYPMMFVLNPFFNWYYMVYGIFTAGQRTWGGPRADAGAADKDTTVQEAIEHAEQTGDELNIKPETFIPAIIAQKEEQALASGMSRAESRRKSRRDVLGRQRSVLQPPPQVEGLFAAPQRTEGGIYRYTDPVADSSGASSVDLPSAGIGAPRRRGAGGGRGGRGGGRPKKTMDVEMRVSSYESSLTNDMDAKGKETATYDNNNNNNNNININNNNRSKNNDTYDKPYQDEPLSTAYVPSSAPPEAEHVGDIAFMNEEDRRKYEMAQSWKLGSSMAQPRHFQQPMPVPQGRMYEFPQIVQLREEGYAETLPGTPVNVPGGGGETPPRAEFGTAEGYRDGSDERQGLMVPDTADGGGDGRGRRGRGRSPLAQETYLRVPFEDDDEVEESQQEDERDPMHGGSRRHSHGR